MSAAACEKPVSVTSREPTLQRERTGPSLFEELAAVREKVNAQEPLGATVYWFADACAQVAFESARVYAVRDGPASGATVKVCAVLLRLVMVRVRVAGAPAAVTMPKSSSEALRVRGSADVVVAGRVSVVDATPEAESVSVPGPLPLSARPHCEPGASELPQLVDTA